MIIPFFIPHSGCPHQCVFCNQKNITGKTRQPDLASVAGTIGSYIKTHHERNRLDPRFRGNDEREDANIQVAFYGGSFTALDIDMQKTYLEAVRPFILTGQVKSIRLSTRPDSIDRKILALLKNYHVQTVELGVQSMDDRVLDLSGRGHSAADTVNAATLLREEGFLLGLQLMPSLPGDSAEKFHDTVGKAIALKPDFVRIYPVLVIRDTQLEGLYKTGRYTPLPIDEAVSLCREALIRFEQAGIEVIRIGLQPTEELGKPGTVLAGPYHPAFRQLVESSILLDRMKALLTDRKPSSSTVTILVNPQDISAAAGQKRSNTECLKKQFALKTLHIRSDRSVPRRAVKLAGENRT
jgi:histone acetyltransferase (RNA polymerase elongator complex component)